ncbi:GntR family transcriptional regulator [Fodinicola acaciae]|uniref:GntR family transcriptional regulator n=1 Tax=Fodinicola acaciae TaxID=2681555 RepID=UPI0013D3FC8B|nr:GntR family transcriptional regulator [Fodinicola acaciae]
MDGPSLSEEVYRRLRQEIVHGDLRPRESLSEVEIAERLQVSRTPVRESLQRLASEGLITSHRRRWIVYEHSKAEISEIYEVRAALESYSARLAALRATDDELVAIAALRGGQTRDQRIDYNEHLHDSIIRLSHNETLLRQTRTSRLYFFNRTVASLYTEADLVKSTEQHDTLIDAVCDRDPDRAEAAARDHVEFALELILHRLPG